MAKEIFEISRKITQTIDYGKLVKMYEKVKIGKSEKQKIADKIIGKFLECKTERKIYHIAKFTYIIPEDQMLELMKEKLTKEGLIMSNLVELAFFDFNPSYARTVKNFFMNGYDIGTLGISKDGKEKNFRQKLYPVKKIRPMNEHPISYYDFYKFANGEFKILLIEDMSIQKINKNEPISGIKNVLEHEKRKFIKSDKHKVPDHIVHF